jgi:peptidoglycan/xylan/chitin deacetylase (PgdA/CDA1 family)
MRHAATGAPFDERGGRLRGVIDFAAGRYPGFLLGLRSGRILPVFHFHEATARAFEPVCQYLVENEYRTVVSDDAARFVREGVSPGDRAVMLAFDDAWASLWLVVEPLLRRYDLRAVAYAIPGRLVDADVVRPTIDTGAVDAADADRAAQPFVTWPELRALAASGRVDVQSHTWSHSMVFTGDRVVGVVGPAFAAEPRLNHPRIDAAGPPEFLEADRVGYPLFPRRSRMSEGRRFFPDPDACARAEALASGSKGSGGLVTRVAGRWESESDQDAEIDRELSDARDLLQDRLRTPVRHVCLPWGVSGPRTRRALERLGFVSAFANRWGGRFAVAAGDDPFFLKRLNGRHIFALPGRGRRTLVSRG